MAEWVHVLIDGFALVSSIAAFLYARRKDANKEEAARFKSLGDELRTADVEIFKRLNALEISMAKAAQREDIDRLTQLITQFQTTVAGSIGKLEGEQKSVSHQVSLMNSYLMSTNIEGRPER